VSTKPHGFTSQKEGEFNVSNCYKFAINQSIEKIITSTHPSLSHYPYPYKTTSFPHSPNCYKFAINQSTEKIITPAHPSLSHYATTHIHIRQPPFHTHQIAINLLSINQSINPSQNLSPPLTLHCPTTPPPISI